jgi:hypothetical protein
MQDQFHVVMGKEFEMYDVTAITLFRNDPRISFFNEILHELEQRAPTLDRTPHWVLNTHDLVRSKFLNKSLLSPLIISRDDSCNHITNSSQVAKLSPEQDYCKAQVEKKFVEEGLNGEKLAVLKEEELLRWCDALVGGTSTGRKAQDKRDELFRELMRLKQTCEMQIATMRHFEE